VRHHAEASNIRFVETRKTSGKRFTQRRKGNAKDAEEYKRIKNKGK